MKIQKKDVSKAFQPITLEITIENYEELNALKRFSGADCTIAGFAYDEDILLTVFEKETVLAFLNSIFHSISD